MSHRYLTHLTTVFLLHMMAIFGGLLLMKNSTEVRSSLHFSASHVLNLQMSTEILATQVAPTKKSVAIPAKQPPMTPSPSPVMTESVSSSSPLAKALADSKAAFKAELRAEIEKNKSYPSLSRRLGQSGTVIVGFTLLEDGHIINVRVESPSRFERLNESAMEAVKKVHKFRPFPNEWDQDRMDITVPVKFFTI